jgi:ATP dependent DNA ligase domain
MAFRAGDRIALYTSNGHDWADRYPLVAAALEALHVRSCLIDGEIVVTRPDGVACFDRLRSRQHDAMAFVYAFDLLELDGLDLRREPLLVRKAVLASVIAKAGAGLRWFEFCGRSECDIGGRAKSYVGLAAQKGRRQAKRLTRRERNSTARLSAPLPAGATYGKGRGVSQVDALQRRAVNSRIAPARSHEYFPLRSWR